MIILTFLYLHIFSMKGILPLLLILTTLLVLCSPKSQYKVTRSQKTLYGVLLQLSYTGQEDYYLKPSNPILKHLQFYFHTHTFNDFFFKIIDADSKRFQVPQNDIIPTDPQRNFTFPLQLSAVTLEYTENPFDFKIIRKQNGAVLFSSYEKNFIFSDHYLEIGTQVQSEFIYGLGERFMSSFRLRDGKWSMFSRDRGFSIDLGEGKNGYGYFPFYLMRERGHFFHINYLRSSNAMDVFKQSYLGRHFVTYKVIGGIFDFRFFLGEQSPQTTIQKLNFYSGKASIPPFWSFGFHQCRWGYKNISFLTDVISNYQKNGIPLDTIWTDIDYMIDYEDFTIDQSRFPISQLKKIKQNYKWIPIIDAGIKTIGPAYQEGLKRGIFLKDPYGKPFVGKVWPGNTTFVDFFHPNATKYWTDMLDTLYQKIQFDGVWLDMNQLANFCNGPCTTPTDPKIYDYSNDLPYHPGNDNIETATIPLNCTHYNNLTQANVHVFHSLLQTYSTNQFLKNKNLKPFVLTRSSTLGSSKYSSHWTADCDAQWIFLQGTISDIFNNQMFGFQMIGADICGFGGNTTVELCSRWYQLGALYPFARSHNNMGSIPQQPYALGPVVLQAATKAIKLRYSLLKYLYTQFVTKRGLGSIWKPLFFVHPLDNNLYIDEIADTEFMLGPDLLITPILQENQTSRKVYFPQSKWYQLYTGKQYSPGTDLITGYTLTDRIPIFIRQGTAVLLQNVTEVVNTKQLDNKFHLYSGFFFNQRRSNSTHQFYQAIGNILSLKNYNQDKKIDLCLTEGCSYVFNIVLNVLSSGKTLDVGVVYIGGSALREQIVINQFTLYYNGHVSHFILSQPLEITGPFRTVIHVPDSVQHNPPELTTQ